MPLDAWQNGMVVSNLAALVPSLYFFYLSYQARKYNVYGDFRAEGTYFIVGGIISALYHMCFESTNPHGCFHFRQHDWGQADNANSWALVTVTCILLAVDEKYKAIMYAIFLPVTFFLVNSGGFSTTALTILLVGIVPVGWFVRKRVPFIDWRRMLTGALFALIAIILRENATNWQLGHIIWHLIIFPASALIVSSIPFRVQTGLTYYDPYPASVLLGDRNTGYIIWVDMPI